MPTLNNPSERARIPVPLTGISSRQPVTTADRVLAGNVPSASTGNSSEDHIEELLARSGHGTATAYATGTTYAVGDEVYWRDGTAAQRLHFYIRLTMGQDQAGSTPNNLPAAWREVVNSLNDIPVDGDASSNALLVRTGGHGAVRAEVDQYTRLQTSQTASEVQSTVNAAADSIVNVSRWRGRWANATDYAVGEYVYHPISGVERYFRRIVAGRGQIGPLGDTANWVELTGVERLSAIRLRAFSELQVASLDLTPAQDNRGLWPQRSRTDEEYIYNFPPMQYRGAWDQDDSYHFGSVVRHSDRLWALESEDSIVTAKTGAATEPGTDSDWFELAITATHPQVVNVDNIRAQILALQQLLVDLHLGQPHPQNYAEDTTTGAGIGSSTSAYTLQTARTENVFAKTDQVGAGHNAVYLVVRLPHAEDQRLFRLRIRRQSGNIQYIQVSQMTNLGNSQTGVSYKYFTVYNQTVLNAGDSATLEKAGTVSHIGATEFAGIGTGTFNGTFGTDSVRVLTQAQYDAISTKERIFYVISSGS